MTSSNMDPPLCANGCGFFGSAANQNLCSQCYKDLLKQNIIKSVQSLDSNESSACDNENNNAAAAAVTVTASDSESEEKKKKKVRCKNCNKKVGLTGFVCRCGDVFCGMHRHPEEHACKFNWKKTGRQLLAKLNPVCKADKLESRV